jgi:hypothetical protein
MGFSPCSYLEHILFIRSEPGFPTSPLSPAPLMWFSPKENDMQLTEAATPDRKSGGADLSRRAVEGSAVSLSPQRILRLQALYFLGCVAMIKLRILVYVAEGITFFVTRSVFVL